jgi:hypothetical protein
MADETLSFFATSDWGGQAAAPYTTPLQLEMATAMGHVSASFHPKFVVSAGGNFLPGGLQGAARSGAARFAERAPKPAELPPGRPPAGRPRPPSPACAAPWVLHSVVRV